MNTTETMLNHTTPWLIKKKVSLLIFMILCMRSMYPKNKVRKANKVIINLIIVASIDD